MPRALEDFRGLGPPLGPDAEGRRLDQFLAQTFPFRSREQWKAVCACGDLLVNGAPARPTRRLKKDDALAVFHPVDSEPEADDGIAFIKEEAGVMAVFKPANLPMHESGLYRRKTFVARLHKSFGAEWAPVHRLDRETSGVVLCAATTELRRRLSLDFETKAIKKHYLALVCGVVPWSTHTVDQPLATAYRDNKPIKIVDRGGQPSLTTFDCLDRAKTASLLSVVPQTGRTNQIRVHCAWMGHPILADKIYQAHGEDGLPGAPTLTRHALHAQSIEVLHPLLGKAFHASAPWPIDLQRFWTELKQKP